MILRLPVVLASGSPRRRQLLADLVPEFVVHVSEVDEDALTVADPFETAEKLALAKAKAVAASYPEALVIGGDTVVAFPADGGWIQLSKPVDSADAVRMLSLLCGRTHTVATGLALVSSAEVWVGHERTQVTFRAASQAEIEAYVATGEPMDKAGAYGLQGAAHDFVSGIEGSRTNVIGLPMELLESALVRYQTPS